LIIKELKLRRIAKRILIVVPGHLRDQWIRELKDRFEETFTSVNRGYVDAHYGESVWERENQIITSMDFIKREAD
jgi:SNF2 family DNA or RNA helicase